MHRSGALAGNAWRQGGVSDVKSLSMNLNTSENWVWVSRCCEITSPISGTAEVIHSSSCPRSFNRSAALIFFSGSVV